MTKRLVKRNVIKKMIYCLVLVSSLLGLNSIVFADCDPTKLDIHKLYKVSVSSEDVALSQNYILQINKEVKETDLQNQGIVAKHQ